jgi:Zn-dependent M16 (insulinase) family peptidase
LIELLTSSNHGINFYHNFQVSGLVYIGFLGPKASTDFKTLTACYALMKYLCDTSVSPMQQSFIEIDEPFASEVTYNVIENSTSCLYFTFENCPADKMDFIYERFIQLLVDIANGKEPIDENRLRVVFEKFILERLTSLENSPHDDVAFQILGDFLYSAKGEDFYARLNVAEIIGEFAKQEKVSD